MSTRACLHSHSHSHTPGISSVCFTAAWLGASSAWWVKVQADPAHCAFRMLPFIPATNGGFMATLDQAVLLVAFLSLYLLALYLCYILVILTKKSSSFSLWLYLLWFTESLHFDSGQQKVKEFIFLRLEDNFSTLRLKMEISERKYGDVPFRLTSIV